VSPDLKFEIDAHRHGDDVTRLRKEIRSKMLENCPHITYLVRKASHN